MVSVLTSQVAGSQTMELPVYDRNEFVGGFLITLR
jgi:hypothetical protein